MSQLFANRAISILQATINSAATSLTVEAGKADRFPVADTGTDPVNTPGKDWFKATLRDSAGNWEIVYVRTRALGSAVLSNVQRAQEGTTAIGFAAGSIVRVSVTAGDIEGTVAHPNDDSGAHAASAISNTPAGNIAATTVQAAINELDTEKAAASHTHTASQITDLGLIANNLTINVPADHATVNEAFDWLRGRTIARGAVVTIKVADGTHALTRSINGNHPQGSQIRLIGNELAPALCVLRAPFPSTFDGLVVSSGHTLGYVNGFKFDLPLKAEWPNNNTGILASNGSTIVCGQKIEVNNWYYGIAARNGSFISCNYAKVSNSGDVGIWAFVGSTVEASYAQSTGASDAVNPCGFGFQAEFGSTMFCTGAQASGCKVGGIASLSNSTVRAYDSITTANTGSGYVARGGGLLDAVGGSTTSNTEYGVAVEDGGYVRYVATNTGNVAGPVNPFSFLTQDGGQARVASSTGPLRLDAGSESPIFMNTPGGVQFEVLHTNSAVNRPYAAGAPAGGPARLGASGSDSDIDLILEPKGTGKVRLGATQAIPGGFATNSIIEMKAADGAIIQIACKRL